ncbi:hypothetical protein MLD38_000681 [Melastoma candidum]|uniref:Uncharacterized protein n=1 Tax=Melastoma candidum TaxID=119954 RepID=A0ACB9SAU2_9MYRT|nr:hypothetical protein MLD38_000681 [Melastoma candidum]
MESSWIGSFGDESSSVSEAPSANTDYHTANEAEDNDGSDKEEGESSWTRYIVDFLINGQEKTTLSSSPLPRETPSLAVVSHVPGLKRRKNKGSSADHVDEALEDTASSPIHTPKLMEDKGIGCGERAVVGSGRGGGGGHSRLLKERGLCLVPLSMAVNNLG